MNEDLINQIVRRILSDPALQALLQESLTGNGDARSIKRDGLILLNYVPDFGRVLSAVKNRYQADYTLYVLPSDQVSLAKPELPEGMTWITAKEALTKRDWHKLILPTCSPNILAKAALGIRDNPMSEVIGRGITEGKALELVTEHLGFTAQTPQAYRELYEGYLQKVQTYGVVVRATLDDECSSNLSQTLNINHYEQRAVTAASLKTASYEPSDSIRGEIRFTKNFLGDKQAYEFPEDTKILVKPGTVISPLARDTLKLRRIELCVEKEVAQG
ncbi:hypothetical protein JCM17380_29490 [Desulfosporosinus burensis]